MVATRRGRRAEDSGTDADVEREVAARAVGRGKRRARVPDDDEASLVDAYLAAAGTNEERGCCPCNVTAIWKAFTGPEWEDSSHEAPQRLRAYDITDYFASPYEIEKFIWTGVIFCLDAFLDCFTVMPFRIVVAALFALRFVVTFTHARMSCKHSYYLLLGAALAVCFYLTSYLDVSKTYHLIRVQSAIKLWLALGALELADWMLCAIGRDVLDSLATLVTMMYESSESLASSPVKRGLLRRLVLSFACVCAYLAGHAATLFMHVMTLTVAFNALTATLVMVIFTTQFNDLRKVALKSYTKETLYPLACADATKRVHLLISLLIITVQNAPQHTDATTLLYDLLLPITGYLSAEILIDCVKYAFIVRLSSTLQHGEYEQFSDRLCNRVVSTQAQPAALSLTAVHELGFVPLPLAVLLVRSILPVLPPLDTWRQLGAVALAAYTTALVLKAAVQALVWRRISARLAKQQDPSRRSLHFSPAPPAAASVLVSPIARSRMD